MLRGFITGSIWGMLFSALVAATVSLLLPLPAQRAVSEPPAQTTPDAEPQAAVTPGGQITATAANEVVVAEPEASTQAADETADVAKTMVAAPAMQTPETPQTPQTSQAALPAMAQKTPAQAGAAQGADDMAGGQADAAPAVAPQTQTDTPAAAAGGSGIANPENEPDVPPAVVQEPATDVSDETAGGGAGVDAAAASPEQPAPPMVETPEQPAQMPQTDTPVAPSDAPARIQVTVQEPESGAKAPNAEESSGIVTANAENSAPPLPAAPAATLPPEDEQPVGKITPASPPAPVIVATAPAAPAPHTPRRLQVGGAKITDRASPSSNRRLPQIISRKADGAGSTGAARPDPATDPDVAQPGIALESTEEKPALVANSVTFDNPRDLPLVSIILIDDAAHPISKQALARFPFPVTFAIDADRDDAEDAAIKYRNAGFEVVILTDLPKDATPQDVEVSFQAYKSQIPLAVALMDRNLNGFQGNRELVKQAAANLAESGHGFLSFDKGLNTAEKLAARAGVKAGLIYRVLDANGEKPEMIRRYLDRAAFRAAKDGQVILLGHTNPDTIEALVLWGLEDRASSVAVAPLSAVLENR